MRNLKFRVWDLKYKDWMKNDCIGIDAEGQILTYRQGGIIGGWIQDENEDFIIQQFTGLLDKEHVEIFDGDVLEHPNYSNFFLDGKYTDPVIYGQTGDSDGYCHEKHFEWVVGHNSLADVYEKSKVIGNIFENPELLK